MITNGEKTGRRKKSIKCFTDNCHKGQLFIIAAIFVVSGLVLIFGLLSSPLLLEEKKFQDIRTLDKNAKNLLYEYKFATGVATLNSPANISLASYLLNLSDYYRREFDSNILYAAFMLNGSTQRFSATVGNYMKDQINMNITATSSSPSAIQFSLTDKANRSVDFAATANASINITLNYTIGNMRTVEIFSINSSTRNYMMLFVDLRLKDETYEIRLKDIYNRSW